RKQLMTKAARKSAPATG
nr:Chain B, Histone 3 peptide H3(17-33)A21M [Homo sapiens]